LKPLVVINKIDRPGVNIDKVKDELLDLFIDLEADEEQLDFPIILASAREGYAKRRLDEVSNNMQPLLDAILDYIPAPVGSPSEELQLGIASIIYDPYVGRIGVGKVSRGSIKKGQEYVLCNGAKEQQRVKITALYTFEGLQRVEVDNAPAGEIIAVAGVESINIGDTLCSPWDVRPLDFVKIDEPTIAMNFVVNDSPMAGLEGKYLTSRHLRDRLMRELLSNVSLRVEELSPDTFKVSGRGELHLSILIETMRRQGYEFAVTRPEVILKQEDGIVKEPIEELFIEVPELYVGTIMEKVSSRRGELLNMFHSNNNSVKLEFSIPARGLIGLRSELLTETRGHGIMHHIFLSYEPYRGQIPGRTRGSLVASESGIAVTYGLYNAQDRGVLFIGPGTEVYEGMIVGENSRKEDITINVCKKKHLTNTRSSGADEALRLVPPMIMSLEKCLEFMGPDELLEVTPAALRLRKMTLDKVKRERLARNKPAAM
jgi:GTP-binding protein